MEQKTGIRSLYDEFFRGYGAEIRPFAPNFCSNSTYKRDSAPTFRARSCFTDYGGGGGRGSGSTGNQGETAAFSYLDLNSPR